MKMKKQLSFKGKNIIRNNAFSLFNLLMYAERIVIPALLQKRMLREFHIRHPGISRMKSLMRCYWPKLYYDIENLVKSYRVCALSAEVMLRQFLSVYRITPNPNSVSGMSPAELMFSGKIKSVFNKLLTERMTKTSRNQNNINKYLKPGDKCFLKCTNVEKNSWKMAL